MMFNESTITDMHVKQIIDNETTTLQFAALDEEIVSVCASLGIQSADIPVDNSGYITAPTLKKWAMNWIMQRLLSDYWGGAMGDLTDIYKAKLDYYTGELNDSRTSLTYENITNTNPSPTAYIKQVVVY